MIYSSLQLITFVCENVKYVVYTVIMWSWERIRSLPLNNINLIIFKMERQEVLVFVSLYIAIYMQN